MNLLELHGRSFGKLIPNATATSIQTSIIAAGRVAAVTVPHCETIFIGILPIVEGTTALAAAPPTALVHAVDHPTRFGTFRPQIDRA